MSTSATKFPLGVYVGNPNGNDPAAEKAFEQQFDAFVRDMGGARPMFMDAFTDFGADPSQWAANAAWGAWSFAMSGSAYAGPGSGITPVVGVPLASNAGGWGNVDTFYKQIIAGQYDSAYRGIVDAWAAQGYKTVQFRFAYEMDGNFMPWAPGNSASPTANADFVAAFQHVADLVHAEGNTAGITAQVVWNPANINWTNYDVTRLYPGDKYVDIISTDVYSPEYPNDLTGWAHGGTSQVGNKDAWAADPANRAHFWQYTNGGQYNPTPALGSPGWSTQNAIDFAKQHGKPLSISETGSGPSGSALGPADDPAFAQWLAGALSAAQAQGVTIQNVNIWDVTVGDGDWNFSNGSKPLAQASWGKYFGAGSGTGGTTPPPASITVGSGADKLVLQVAEDAWQGDAQFTIAVDGKQIGGTLTASASHAAGQSQSVTVLGSFGAGSHTVSVNFLNDAYGGAASTDRNLYVTSATINGNAISGASLTELAGGAQSFGFTVGSPTTPPKTTPTSGQAGLLHAAGNYFATADGKAVYLAGDHTWTNNVSFAGSGQFDFGAYLNVLQNEGANLVRYWAQGQTFNPGGGGGAVSMTPFLRSATPGANDGGNKFDLTKFNQAYFDHVRADVVAAGEKGIYVGVMLFFDADPYGQYRNWNTDFWNGANNVNHTTTDNHTAGTGQDAATMALQTAYVAKMLDTLQDLPNVLWEVANESFNDQATINWQNQIVNFIHQHETSSGGLKHPAGISAPFPHNDQTAINGMLAATNADWIAPQGWQDYQNNPPPANGAKVQIVDTDHTFGIGGDVNWVWQQFTRGQNVNIMDDMGGTGLPGTLTAGVSPAQRAAEASERLGIKETRSVASTLNLAGMKPAGNLASTGYALADTSNGQFVVFAQSGGSFTVDLSSAAGKTLAVQWLNVQTGAFSTAAAIAGGNGRQSFTSPSGDAVLVLTAQGGGATTPPPPTDPTTPPSNPGGGTTPPGAVTVGSGADKLVLQIAEDAWQGDAQYTISIDGKQIGGTLTASASHAAGQSQSVTVLGSFAAGSHTVSVSFLNDAWGGTASTDRNLYVTGATINGKAISGASLSETNNGAKSFSFTVAAAPPVTTPPAAAHATFGDSAGHSITQVIIASGSQDSYAYLTGLNNNVHQSVDRTSGVHAISTDSWGYVNRAAINDQGGGSYRLTNFVEADASLGGAVAAPGKSATLFVDTAQRGTIKLGSGNYDATIKAGNAWGDAAANTFDVTLGPGNDTLALTGSNGSTVAVVHAGSGDERMSFINTASVQVYAGSGQDIVSFGGGSNTMIAGTGALDVTGGKNADTFVFHQGGGLMTITGFAESQGDQIQIDAALKGSLHQTSVGAGTMLSFGSGTGHGVLLADHGPFATSGIKWI